MELPAVQGHGCHQAFSGCSHQRLVCDVIHTFVSKMLPVLSLLKNETGGLHSRGQRILPGPELVACTFPIFDIYFDGKITSLGF